MPQGLPEWPATEFYATWQEYVKAYISRMNEVLAENYDEVGMTANFAVSLPQNGRWLQANGGTFLSASFPQLAQKLGTTFSPAPPAGHTRLPTIVPPANHVSGIRAI